MTYVLNILIYILYIYIYLYILKIYVKKINYFVFIIHQVNNHGVSRRGLTETDVKHFKSGALRTIIITRSIVNCTGVFQNFPKCKFLCRYFSRILLIDSESPTLKMDFLKLFFENFADRFQNSYQSKNSV